MVREVFQNAPITEAILDIRVQLPDYVGLDKLAIYQEKIINEFPTKQERVAWQGGIEINAGGTPEVTSSGGPDGFLFRSEDDKKIVQARLDGFTFNMVKPYSQWEDFLQEAQSLWDHYLQIAQPTSIVKLGLRYINHIELPLPFTDFKEYILTIPEIAPGIPQGLADFFMQLVIPDENTSAFAILTETIDKNRRNENVIPIIFDIDVVNELLIDAKADFWGHFEQMHVFKNKIFFNSITEKGREMFR